MSVRENLAPTLGVPLSYVDPLGGNRISLSLTDTVSKILFLEQRGEMESKVLLAYTYRKVQANRTYVTKV